MKTLKKNKIFYRKDISQSTSDGIIYKKILLVLIFILFLSITNNVFSAESWYFTLLSSEDYGATYQRVENGGYTSETECLKILNNNYASRTDLKPSTKCFLVEPATITSFTPSSGKLGSTITITGKNFIKVTDVSVGGANANYTVNSPTSLVLTIPNAAVTGKIKIVTEIRGTATSTSDFTISSIPSDMYWWYMNGANEFYGATGRLQTPGFIDEDPCNTKRLAYEKSSSQAKTTGPCFKKTQTQILKEKADSYGATPIGPAKAAGSAVSSVYTFLAPIGTMTEINTTDIGVYFNWIFKLAIGLCAALAVIMIIVGGVQYMGDESVFGKTDAKDRIMKAILGLLIAIGSWVLLNTINPALTGKNGVSVAGVNITISPNDTSTGSSTNPSLCLSTTNPPNPNLATGTATISNNADVTKYITEINKMTSYSLGKRILAIAQTRFEGFSSTPSPGTLSYRTNNPGNIGNTDDGKTKTFATLNEGIKAQLDKVVSGQGSYQIGGKSTCALGNEEYKGYLYQYLRIYATGARQNNNYLNSILSAFKANGITITAKTTMNEIYAIVSK